MSMLCRGIAVIVVGVVGADVVAAAPAGPGAQVEAARGDQPAGRTSMTIEGFPIRVDDRLGDSGGDGDLGREALAFLAARLADIRRVVPPDRLERLRRVTIVIDRNCGDLAAMQYHPSAEWLERNGYPATLAKCVHIPRAASLATRRNVNQQPWVVLHELAHAYHDQVLGFDEPRILAAWEEYRRGGRGEQTLLYNGDRVRHYGLTDHKEFFAEMTEAYFGTNDFHPFNRAELKEEFPRLHTLLTEIWGPADP